MILIPLMKFSTNVVVPFHSALVNPFGSDLVEFGFRKIGWKSTHHNFELHIRILRLRCTSSCTLMFLGVTWGWLGFSSGGSLWWLCHVPFRTFAHHGASQARSDIQKFQSRLAGGLYQQPSKEAVTHNCDTTRFTAV